MTPQAREWLVGLCAKYAGQQLDAEQSWRFDHQLARVVRREGFPSVVDLLRALRDRGEERLILATVEALLPHQSAFFRDPPVFEALVADLRRRLKLANAAPVRVWSAGCGAGQEAYSLAMSLIGDGVANVELVASDLNELLLNKARRGLYGAPEVQIGLSARRLVRHFENHEDGFVAAPDLRARIQWRRHNLLDPGAAGEFDVILCRYVVGSMTAAAQAQVLVNLANSLRPGGRLVLGLGEQIPRTGAFTPVALSPGAFELAMTVPAAA